MRLGFRHSQEDRKLPVSVQEYMRRRFILLPEYLETLRCFVYDSTVNEKQVKRISVFSPIQAREHGLFIKTETDLHQHPEMLLYEGYVDNQGKAYVADRRTPSRLDKSS